MNNHKIIMSTSLLKDRLIKIGIRSEKAGLCRHKTGNFSLLLPDDEGFLITPSGMERTLLTPNDIITINTEGEIKKNINNNKPSIETKMHFMIYKEREDVGAVVHTHSPYATAFAVKNMEIRPVATEAVFYGEKTVLVPFAPPGSSILAENLKKHIQDSDVFLLERHGLIAVADTIENAFLKAVYAEKVAQIDFISRQLRT